MSKSIRLSKKYGVNPTIPVCFFCGNERNEVALLGKIGKGSQDLEAPMKMVIDYEPCDECRKNMNMGVALIGVVTEQPEDKRPPISVQQGKEIFPTGSMIVLKEEAAQRIFSNTELKAGDKLLADEGIINQLDR